MTEVNDNVKRFDKAREETLKILTDHQMVEVTGSHPYDFIGIRCSCNRGKPDEFFSENDEDFFVHVAEAMTEVFRNERARELEDVRNTKSGRAISISLKNREKILLEAPEDFIQCEMCLGGGTHWSDETRGRVTCTVCGGLGLTNDD